MTYTIVFILLMLLNCEIWVCVFFFLVRAGLLLSLLASSYRIFLHLMAVPPPLNHSDPNQACGEEGVERKTVTLFFLAFLLQLSLSAVLFFLDCLYSSDIGVQSSVRVCVCMCGKCVCVQYVCLKDWECESVC